MRVRFKKQSVLFSRRRSALSAFSAPYLFHSLINPDRRRFARWLARAVGQRRTRLVASDFPPLSELCLRCCFAERRAALGSDLYSLSNR